MSLMPEMRASTFSPIEGVQPCLQPDGRSDPGRLRHGRVNIAKPGRAAPRGREVTVVKGEPLPPTTAPHRTYTLVDPTKNRSGMGA
jgi:hypothetical protein